MKQGTEDNKLHLEGALKRHQYSPFFSQLQPVLNYLKNCKNIPHDWTSTHPILPPPATVRQVAAQSFLEDDLRIPTSRQDDTFLREAVIQYFQRCEIPCTDKNIFIGTGTFDILNIIFRCFKDNTRLLIATPTFGYYITQCYTNNFQVSTLATKPENNWKITPAELDKELSRFKPEIFLWTNPVNPTGVVYEKEEIIALAEVLKKHNTLVISDEVFRDISEKKPFSIGAVEGMRDRVITLNSPSKSRGLMECRASFACFPEHMLEIVDSMHERPLEGFHLPTQKALAEAIKDTAENRDYLDRCNSLYKERINYIKEQITLLNEHINNSSDSDKTYVKMLIEPQASSLVLLDFSSLYYASYNGKPLLTGLDIAIFLRDEAGVAMVPGEGFFIEPEKMVLRMSSSYEPEEIAQGFQKIANACSKLKPPPEHLIPKAPPGFPGKQETSWQAKL